MKSDTHLQQKKLWIVEDNLASYDLMASVFQGLYQITHFQDGESCIRNLSAERPDILILDMLLPGESGSDVLRIFKAVDQTNHIPIVVVSAVNSPETIEQTIKDGASAYITKPFKIGNLIDTLNAAGASVVWELLIGLKTLIDTHLQRISSFLWIVTYTKKYT